MTRSMQLVVPSMFLVIDFRCFACVFAWCVAGYGGSDRDRQAGPLHRPRLQQTGSCFLALPESLHSNAERLPWGVFVCRIGSPRWCTLPSSCSRSAGCALLGCLVPCCLTRCSDRSTHRPAHPCFGVVVGAERGRSGVVRARRVAGSAPARTRYRFFLSFPALCCHVLAAGCLLFCSDADLAAFRSLSSLRSVDRGERASLRTHPRLARRFEPPSIQ